MGVRTKGRGSLMYGCPVCGAAPGDACVRLNGKPLTESHPVRVRMAKAARR